MGERSEILDVAKGYAIVLGHVIRGIRAASVPINDSVYRLVDTALYSWHLPIFALVSGLFVQNSIKKYGNHEYLARRISLFVWLYLLWSVLQGLIKVIAGNSVNVGLSFWQVFDFAHPEGQLWFFPWITIATIIVVAVHPWSDARRAVVLLTASGLLAVLAWGFTGNVIGTQGISLYVWFFVGAVVGPQRFLRGLSLVPIWLLAPLVACSAILLAVGANGPTSGYLDWSSGLLTGLALTCCCVLSVLLLSKWHIGFLSFLGKKTLPIFTAHILFASGTRIVLMRLGVDSFAVLLPFCLCAGIAGPLVLERFSAKWCPWLFSVPRGDRIRMWLVSRMNGKR